MWHLRTKLGTFWVIEASQDNKKYKYFLGVDDQELGAYEDYHTAAKDVYCQHTGYFKWDSQDRVRVPQDISEWHEGEPEGWGG